MKIPELEPITTAAGVMFPVTDEWRAAVKDFSRVNGVPIKDMAATVGVSAISLYKFVNGQNKQISSRLYHKLQRLDDQTADVKRGALVLAFNSQLDDLESRLDDETADIESRGELEALTDLAQTLGLQELYNKLNRLTLRLNFQVGRMVEA